MPFPGKRSTGEIFEELYHGVSVGQEMQVIQFL
jgi:hypothetical protein